MSFLDTVVNVSISATSATPSLPGTNIPAILAYHTHNTDLIRTYQDLAGMATDGFSIHEPAYLMAQSIVQQNPRPSTFKIIRGTTAVQQVMTFNVTDHNDGEKIGLTLTDAGGVVIPVYVTASSQTAAQVATALAALTVAGATLGVSASTLVTITVTASGKIFYPSLMNGGTFTDTTLTDVPATDLTAALLVDNSWYGISGEQLGAASIAAVASWAESNKKAHFYTTADSANLAASSGVMHTLQTSAYKYSVGMYSGTPMAYGGTGWMANGLCAAPGSWNFAYKAIAGDTVDALNPTQETNLQGNNGNFYINMAGVNVAIDGRAASGQFIDLQIGIDGLSADIQVRVATLLTTMPKLPYTRKGIAAVGAEIAAALQAAVAIGFLSNDAGFEFAVQLPDLAKVSTADKVARTLRNVAFTCFAQGAINLVKIIGTVNI